MKIEQGPERSVGVCQQQSLWGGGKDARALGQEGTASGQCGWSVGGRGPGIVRENLSKSSQGRIRRLSKAMMRTLE